MAQQPEEPVEHAMDAIPPDAFNISLPIAAPIESELSGPTMVERQPGQYPVRQFVGTYGSYERVNFGKHKGSTWFDIANSGDYGYLNWCLNGQKLKLDSTCKEFIQTALMTQGSNAKWTLKKGPVKDQPLVTNHWYETHLYGKLLKSPDIWKYECTMCHRVKNVSNCSLDQKMCKSCIWELGKELQLQPDISNSDMPPLPPQRPPFERQSCQVAYPYTKRSNSMPRGLMYRGFKGRYNNNNNY